MQHFDNIIAQNKTNTNIHINTYTNEETNTAQTINNLDLYNQTNKEHKYYHKTITKQTTYKHNIVHTHHLCIYTFNNKTKQNNICIHIGI